MATSTALVRATVLAGPGLEPLPDAAVIIEGETIAAVGDAVPDGAEVVDVRGLTLAPGFIDAHVHLGLADPGEVVRRGVTSARDLGWPTGIFALAARSRAAGFRGPHVTAVGRIMTAPGGYPTRARWAPAGTGLEVADGDEAGAAVEAMASAGATAIKVALDPSAGPTLTAEALAALVVAAHERSLKVTAHIGGLDELSKAMDARVDELAHMLMGAPRIPAGMLHDMVARDMTIVPTLAIFFGRARRVAIDNLRRWHDLGGRVVYGTDLGNSGPRPGIDEREVTGMLQAGMSPRDVIGSATTVAAEWLNLPNTGFIAPSMTADIVAFDGDPLADAGALTRIARVWRSGRSL
ncbi:MAG: amidohydrolase family protein [Actinomycetota bacterium]